MRECQDSRTGGENGNTNGCDSNTNGIEEREGSGSGDDKQNN